jgi:hypothetical protein
MDSHPSPRHGFVRLCFLPWSHNAMYRGTQDGETLAAWHGRHGVERSQANRRRLKRIEKPSMSSSGMKTALMTIAAQVQAVYGRNRVNVPQEVAR